MKKQYTKKQIQEAIAYWKKQLNEGLFDGNPVRKFFNELKTAMAKPQFVQIGASKKDGKTYGVSSFELDGSKITFYAGDTTYNSKKILDAKEFIEQLLAENVKAKSIDDIEIQFQDGVYKLSDVTVMETTSKVYGRGILIILDVDAQGYGKYGNFFS